MIDSDNSVVTDASRPVGRVVELFAGVGGFRLGLEGLSDLQGNNGGRPGRWRVIWANQWEPSTKQQHAFECYSARFSSGIHSNEDISTVDLETIPCHDLLVGGFPCQDYSVAKLLNQAHGIQGGKGVLWWSIHRIIEAKRPRFVLLENVDRLLKSPGNQRGRDFAIMLATLSDLGYLVEWRVVNAADYGFPQRRRRVFIVAQRKEHLLPAPEGFDGFSWITRSGIIARALPATSPNGVSEHPKSLVLEGAPHEISERFGQGRAASQFMNAGVMLDRVVWTRTVAPEYTGPYVTLGSILLDESEVPDEYFIPADRLGDPDAPARGTWRYLKNAKREERTHKGSGRTYMYSEGALTFPDRLDRPGRTVLTGEGGSGPSRFKHVVQTDSGHFRRLTPVELERLNGFPDGWTEGMSDIRRAFCMGNALVVGVVERIGKVIAEELSSKGSTV